MSQSFYNESSNQTNLNQQHSLNHGGHEMMDMHETIGEIIAGMNQAIILRPHVKDPELLNILDRQYNFTLGMYNTIVESFKTGHDPSVPTGRYQMETGNDFKYGLNPGQSKSRCKTLMKLMMKLFLDFYLSSKGAQKMYDNCVGDNKPCSSSRCCG